MSDASPNSRLEMFSDGVIAIAITLLIIEIKVPSIALVNSTADVWHALFHLWPSFVALLLSFIIIFLSWYGHHVLLNALGKASTRFQFANGFFLLTVVVLPFPTAFMAEYLNTEYAQPAIMVYCISSLIHNIGWRMLLRSTKKPIDLARTKELSREIRELIKWNQFGTFIIISIVILSIWFPHIALTLSILMWTYWLVMTLAAKNAHR